VNDGRIGRVWLLQTRASDNAALTDAASNNRRRPDRRLDHRVRTYSTVQPWFVYAWPTDVRREVTQLS
jgi:hypothetical protein